MAIMSIDASPYNGCSGPDSLKGQRRSAAFSTIFTTLRSEFARRPIPLPQADAAGGDRPFADRGKGHKRDVLFVSRQRIVGPTNGSSTYLLDLASATRRAGFKPHLLQPSPTLMGRWPVMRLMPAMTVFESHAIRGVLKVGPWVVSLDPKVYVDAAVAVFSRLMRRWGFQHRWLSDRPRPYSIASEWTKADRKFVRRVGSGNADIVIADYVFQSDAFTVLHGRPSAIVMHDLFHRRAAPADHSDSVASLDREREIALLKRADAVIAIQAEEAQFVKEHIAGLRAVLAPLAVRPVSAVQPGDPNRLLFVASNTAPNVVGLEWFFDRVWPIVKRKCPSATLDVAGTVALAFPQGGPGGVTFHGVVRDLKALYKQAGIVISPLTFGSGLKIKLVEALAQGKAIVATPTTLQGVERECANAVIATDDPHVFAEAILRLNNAVERNALSEAALAAAKRHFSQEACHADFVSWLNGCVSGDVTPSAMVHREQPE